MNKKIVIGLVVVVVLVIAVAMSGKKNNAPAEVVLPMPVPGTNGQEMLVENDGSLSGGVTPSETVREIVVLGSNFAFAPSALTIKQGERIRLVFNNTGGNHDFKIDELGVATKIIKGGETDTVEFTADKKGTFEFYCSVGSHRAMGMKGTITVQ